ncbi:hypothetical protein XELAEV_18034960mg [Xenopus laevis]|uniref:Uncharacterized protein n=1 Tax=Xenopus laevis TaxID=8355 RepID=A0A974CFE4_XENLA|nr:hypothetical protein XELAEV_18034960mg [Xenopus laevis]
MYVMQWEGTFKRFLTQSVVQIYPSPLPLFGTRRPKGNQARDFEHFSIVYIRTVGVFFLWRKGSYAGLY